MWSARWRGLSHQICQVSPPTQHREITRIVEREIVPVWKDRLVSDIKKKDIHALLDKIEAHAPAMANCYSRLSGSFSPGAWSAGLSRRHPAQAFGHRRWRRRAIGSYQMTKSKPSGTPPES